MFLKQSSQLEYKKNYFFYNYPISRARVGLFIQSDIVFLQFARANLQYFI